MIKPMSEDLLFKLLKAFYKVKKMHISKINDLFRINITSIKGDWLNTEL